MVEFENRHLKIYRLTEAQENCEFLMYDTMKDKTYQYSMRRGKDMLKMMLEKMDGKPLSQILVDSGVLEQEKNTPENVSKVFQALITDQIKIIENIDYYPVDQELFEQNNGLYFNMYKKADILKEDLSEYQDMDFPYIRTLLMNLVGNDEQGYEYLTNWLSWLINNPTQRLATSIVLQGQQGSGKTLFTNYILKKIFDSNFTEIGQEDINDSFSEFMMGKQMVIANEVMYNEKKSGSSEKLKNFVTDDFVNVRRKYRDSLFMRNYCHFIFTSNQQIPIKIEKNDRRFTVFKSNKLPNGVEFYQEFMKVYETEVRAFIEYLRSKEVRLSQVNYPYFNAAKKDIIDASLNSVESFVYDANEIGGFLELNNYYGENYQHEGFYNLLELSKGRENMLRLDSLHRLYQRWCVANGIKHAYGRNGFTSMLKHMDYQITVAKDDQDRSVRVLKLKTEEQEE